MPRVYVSKSEKPYKRYDPLILAEAVETYKSGNKSLAEIAKHFNITKSVLHRHITRKVGSQGGQRALSDEAEQYIIKYINICSEWGYPLDTYDLRTIIKGYLDRMGTEIRRFKNNFPGVDYIEGFLKRHKQEISARISQNIKRSRAAVSPQVIEEYFTELQNSLKDVPLSNILNYDESNLADDPGKKKVLTKRGVKYPERVMNHTKSSTSLMMAASADGTLLPCYVVYKSSNLYNTWTTNGPPNCRYNRTNSGWFDGNTFEDWVESVAIPHFNRKPGKKILIGDNLSSHLSVELVKKCQEHDIHFVFLPPNSTHLTQPLDIAFFRPMKMAWRDILFTWKKSEGRIMPTIPKNVFPKLLKKLIEKMEPNTKQNILAGFRKAGISPLNKDIVLSRLPGNNLRQEFCMEEKEAIDESVLLLLQEMRYGPQNTKNIRKSKKINVIPGKSVQDSSDYLEGDISNTDSQKEDQSQTKNKNAILEGKENQIPDQRLKSKAKGKKSKPKKYNNKLNKDAEEKEREILQDKQILKEQQNLYIDATNIENIPIILEENLTEEYFLTDITDYREKNIQQPRIRIISDEPIKLKPGDDQLKSPPSPNHLTGTVEPQPGTSGLRRQRFYKDDMEIFRDLMGSDED